MTAADEPIVDWPGAAAFMGSEYDRYSFTKGTGQEVAFLVEALDLGAHTTVVDLGCGTGRHLAALRQAGVPGVVGLDLAEGFARVVPGPVAVGDVRRLPFADASADVVLGLCEGGIGLVSAGADGDGAVLAEVARVLKPGGRTAMTVFAGHFAVRHLEHEAFDPATGSVVEMTEVRGSGGERRPFRMAAVTYTARELELLHAAAGLKVDHVWSVGPGDYAARPPDLEHPELLVLASK